jgi:phage/plasmid-associated DNA primase
MHAYLVTELKQNDKLEQGMRKAIISDEMMSVEHKFQDPREIEPFAKDIILTNHMPRIKDYSDGLFRRISIIKLIRKFDRDAKDPNRSKKLMQLSRAHWMPYLFSSGIWWIGFKMNRSGSDVQVLQMYS